MILTIVIFVVVLSVIVFAHELGHFFTARYFGTKTEEFGFGLPPRVFGVYRSQSKKWRWVRGSRSSDNLALSDDEDIRPGKKSTIYSLNWLPIGGFVKIKGENGEGKSDEDSFSAKKIWQRALILSAGVIMNIVLAWFLFSVGYMIGLPQSTEDVSNRATVTEQTLVIAQVVENSPAEQAGLQVGDMVLSANDIIMSRQEDLQQVTNTNLNQEIKLKISRDDGEKDIILTPVLNTESERGEIGVAVFSGGLVTYPFFYAIWEGLTTTLWLLKEIVLAFVALFIGIFSGHGVGGQFAGPIGIAGLSGQMARLGLSYLIQFTAFLSLNLDVLNFLPFPALDGGRVLFLLIEKIKGKPVKQKVESIIHNFGFMLLIALVIFITFKDIIRLF